MCFKGDPFCDPDAEFDYPDYPEYEEYEIGGDDDVCSDKFRFFQYFETVAPSFDIDEPQPLNLHRDFMLPEERCSKVNGTTCVTRSGCSKEGKNYFSYITEKHKNWDVFLDFSGGSPPVPCGWDKTTGEDQFCCTGPPEDIPRPEPLFSRSVSLKTFVVFKINVFVGLRKYPCIDHSKECERFAKIAPESCTNPNDLGYLFMRYGCMGTCDRCGDEASLFHKTDKNNILILYIY